MAIACEGVRYKGFGTIGEVVHLDPADLGRTPNLWLGRREPIHLGDCEDVVPVSGADSEGCRPDFEGSGLDPEDVQSSRHIIPETTRHFL
jgi:hypothetical protein